MDLINGLLIGSFTGKSGGKSGGSYSSFDNAAGGQTYKIKVGQELVMTDLVATENGVYDKPVIIGEPVFEVGEKLVFKPNIVLDVDFPKTIFDDFGPYVFFFDGQYRNSEGGRLIYDECILRRAINQATGEVVGFFIMLTVNAENFDFLGYRGVGTYVYFDSYTAGINALEPGWYKDNEGTYTKLDTPPYLMLGEETSFGISNHEYNPALLAIKGVFEGKSTPADGWHTVTVDLDASGGLCSTVENEAGGLAYDIRVGDVGEESGVSISELFFSSDSQTDFIPVIELPTVERIRNYAFHRNQVEIGEIRAPKLKIVGYNAFSYCTGLRNTKLPDTIEEVQNYGFAYCQQLVLDKLPKNLKKVCQYGFTTDYNVAITELPDGLEEIGTAGFNQTSPVFTKIPKSLKKIGNGAFSACRSLTSLTFEGKPDVIDSTAFSYCENVSVVNVPWAEGEVAGAPWGMTNATINYNYTEEG